MGGSLAGPSPSAPCCSSTGARERRRGGSKVGSGGSGTAQPGIAGQGELGLHLLRSQGRALIGTIRDVSDISHKI